MAYHIKSSWRSEQKQIMQISFLYLLQMTEAVTNISLQFWDSIDFSKVLDLSNKKCKLWHNQRVDWMLVRSCSEFHSTGAEQVWLPVLGAFSAHILPGSDQFLPSLDHRFWTIQTLNSACSFWPGLCHHHDHHHSRHIMFINYFKLFKTI